MPKVFYVYFCKCTWVLSDGMWLMTLVFDFVVLDRIWAMDVHFQQENIPVNRNTGRCYRPFGGTKAERADQT